jgi:RNA polymerase sigma factor (sigma-70 family)
VSTSAEFNDRNQDLFQRRYAVRDRIAELEAAIAERDTPAAKPKKATKTKATGKTTTKTSTKTAAGRRKTTTLIDDESVDLDLALRRARTELDGVDTEIIQANYGLVLNYVRKFTSTTSREDSRDFEGAAVLGLMRAISTYDPTKGSKFSTWAYKPIQRECLKAVRDADFKHLNTGDFEKRPDIRRALKQLKPEDSDPMPTYEAIAALAMATVDTVKRVLNTQEHDSLNRPINDDGKGFLGDSIPDSDPSTEDSVIARQELTDLEQFGLNALEERELFVISRRFGLDAEPPQRLSAIGTLLGLSREAVRQVEAKALSKLNHPVTRRRLMRHGRD